MGEVIIKIFGDGNCGSMDSAMTSDMMCAGVMEGGKDSCQGDSGGPLVTADSDNNGAATLAGVVSWGYGCAGADSLGIYAEVSHFRDWLDSVMPDLSTCPPPDSSNWALIVSKRTCSLLVPRSSIGSRKLKTLLHVKCCVRNIRIVTSSSGRTVTSCSRNSVS